jgi:hypothetical protein
MGMGGMGMGYGAGYPMMGSTIITPGIGGYGSPFMGSALCPYCGFTGGMCACSGGMGFGRRYW